MEAFYRKVNPTLEVELLSLINRLIGDALPPIFESLLPSLTPTNLNVSGENFLLFLATYSLSVSY
jgi:hypothetical protein